MLILFIDETLIQKNQVLQNIIRIYTIILKKKNCCFRKRNLIIYIN